MIAAPPGYVVRLTYPQRLGEPSEDIELFAFSEEGEPLVIGRRGLVFVDELLEERGLRVEDWEICAPGPAPASEERSLLTVEEAAEYLQISRTTAYAQTTLFERTDGASGIPVVRVGRSLRVPRAALVELGRNTLNRSKNMSS